MLPLPILLLSSICQSSSSCESFPHRKFTSPSDYLLRNRYILPARRTMNPWGLNKGLGSKFYVGSGVQQKHLKNAEGCDVSAKI